MLLKNRQHQNNAKDSVYLYWQEVKIVKRPGEKLGMSIKGGARSIPGNPLDDTDEGVFISKVSVSYIIFNLQLSLMLDKKVDCQRIEKACFVIVKGTDVWR